MLFMSGEQPPGRPVLVGRLRHETLFFRLDSKLEMGVELPLFRDQTESFLSQARPFAFAASQRLAAHRGAGAVGTHTEYFARGGLVDRGFGATPAGHPGAHSFDHALDLAGVDFQPQIGQQILAGGSR